MVKDTLYTWEEARDLEMDEIQELYRKFVNPGQVELIGTFGFGRVKAVSAQGPFIQTADGRRILDMTGGVGVLNHGHNHPRILAARIRYQQQKNMEVHKNFLSQYVAALSHNIATLLPEDLDVSYFCNSGAECVEGAVKLAYKAHGGKRANILSADIAFHGKLLGAAGLTGSGELNFQFPTIPGCHRFVYNDLDSVRELVSVLRRDCGESDIYALVLEPFNASSLTACTPQFLRGVRDICDAEGIVLIFDEVYSGWGKTGQLFYFMTHGVVPDILTYAKSFGGGKASISGYTARTPLFMKAYGDMAYAILHSTTYNGFGEETITAMEAVNIIVEEDYPARSRALGEHLRAGLERLRAKYPDFVAEVRGAGALNGLVFHSGGNALLRGLLKAVPGKMFKDPRFLAKLVNGGVIAELFNEHGVLAFFGDNHNVPLVLSPSLVAENEHLDMALEALDATLAQGRKKLLAKFVKQKYLATP